ncbi:MAG: hypothetical protein M3451_02930 [Chloroflexota bacterium]|nr:hypothetical protein [Chloroflexota bacterium]
MTDPSPDSSDRDDPVELARLLIEECERRSIAARAQHGPAQAAQGLNAELFRARQQLELAELAASENLARCVDLEGWLAAEVERLREHHQKELATAGEALQRSGIEAEALRLAMAELKARAAEMETLLEQVLSSRSWTVTRPMRRLIERVRGRPWHEPRLPQRPR